MIIGTNRDLDLERYIRDLLETKEDLQAARDQKTRYLVHSTTKAGWKSITRDYTLKSINRLKEQGLEVVSVGKKYLGDPDDYLNYIHFSPYNTLHTEYVVLSRQRDRIITNENERYVPGVRIYLDKRKMDRDGVIIYDGLHYAKIRHTLDLKKYMIHFVRGQDKFSECTVKEFFAYATEEFESFLGEYEEA